MERGKEGSGRTLSSPLWRCDPGRGRSLKNDDHDDENYSSNRPISHVEEAAIIMIMMKGPRIVVHVINKETKERLMYVCFDAKHFFDTWICKIAYKLKFSRFPKLTLQNNHSF